MLRKTKETPSEDIFERDNHTCLVSGTHWGARVPCGGPLTRQHRAARQAGGSKLLGMPENLVTLCLVHNSLDMSSSLFRDFCLRTGISVEKWVVEPNIGERDSIERRVEILSGVPVMYPDGWYTLSGLRRRPISSETAVRIITDLYGA